RFVRISAAAAGLGLLPSGRTVFAGAAPVVWRGTMMGAVATVEIHHADRSEAQRLVASACAEALRLGRLFGIYLPDSAPVQLNRTGIVVDPAPELVDLLSASRRYSDLTGGLFDPTVQPLWKLYVDHFASEGADPAGPPRARVDEALARVDY